MSWLATSAVGFALRLILWPLGLLAVVALTSYVFRERLQHLLVQQAKTFVEHKLGAPITFASAQVGRVY